jgi:nitroreductase
MKTLESARKRRSVRTCDGKGLTPEDSQKIMDFAEKAENPYGLSIAWKLLDAQKDGLTTPVIVGTDVFIGGKMLRAPHAEEAFGYSFEKIVLFAESLSIGTTWIAGTMDRPAFERAMELAGGEVMPCVSPLGYPAEKMSLRETVMRTSIKADSRMDFGEVFFDGSFDKPLTESAAGKLLEAFEAVRIGPSAVNRQPWRIVLCGNKAHFYEKDSKGLSGNDWDVQKIDMGIALSHFELAAKDCGFETEFEISDPGLAVPASVKYIASYTIKEQEASK